MNGAAAGRAVRAFVLSAALLSAGCGGARNGGSAVIDAGAPAGEVLPPLSAVNQAAGRRLQVLASTDVVADVVRNVAGEAVDLSVLMADGQDPHAYEPTPRDVAAVEQADVLFISGLGLEQGIQQIIGNPSLRTPVVPVSAGIAPLTMTETEGPEAGQVVRDPHVWFDPANVITWTANIALSLSQLDPVRAATYQANADRYALVLDRLGNEIQEQVAGLAPARRKLVTDHDALSYFAARFGFKVVGAVIPGLSTMSEPSARDLAGLISAIRAEQVPAVFIGSATNPQLAATVARETGARVYPLYTGAMGGAGSGADTYVSMMRANVRTIIQGLGG